MLQTLPLTLYTTAQTRELEQLAIASGLDGWNLMKLAGSAAFRVLRENWPDARQVAIFCGGGNNGGDGYVVAHLLLMAGFQVCVYALAAPEQLKAEALQAYQAYANAHGLVKPFVPQAAISGEVIVDALLGTGLSGPVRDQYAEAIAVINGSGKPVLSLDVPSGINADTGAVMGHAVKATFTVSFIGLKQGLVTGSAPEYTGETHLAGLTLAEALYRQVPSSVTCVAHKPFTKRDRCAHKGANGHVLIIGGAPGYSGAALLASQAALRSGSGLVSLATHPAHAGWLNAHCPELMCHAAADAEALTALLAQANVVVIGPGLGQTAWSTALLEAVLNIAQPLILDADALNLLAKKNLPNGLHPQWILTPHPGEAARLLHTTNTEVQQDRFTAARSLQARYGGIVVLKGAGTLIASTDGIAVATTGNPGMGSGGMGDLLTGVIAGLCAQGLDLLTATQQGVYLHGAAADNAADESGGRGLLASDLLPYIRRWVN